MTPETIAYLHKELETLQGQIPSILEKLNDADYLMSFGTSTVQDYCVTQKVIQWIEHLLEDQSVIDNGGLIDMYKSRIISIIHASTDIQREIHRKILNMYWVIGELEGIDMTELKIGSLQIIC